MKLEQERESLSGRQIVAEPIAPVGPRTCVSCGVEDVAREVEGQYGVTGQKLFEHLVTIELRYLKKPEDCTSYLKARGWSFRVHQGRPAMQRFICRPCMNAHAIMEKEFKLKRSRELGSNSNHDTYYTALCGE
jgi:hypothetical protein